MYSDLTKDTSADFLKELNNFKNFHLRKWIAGVKMVLPWWAAHGVGFMENWCMVLGMANSTFELEKAMVNRDGTSIRNTVEHLKTYEPLALRGTSCFSFDTSSPATGKVFTLQRTRFVSSPSSVRMGG